MKRLILSLLLILTLVFIEASLLYSQATFDTGTLGVTIGTYGRVRFYTPNSTGIVQMERISILVGASSEEVFDYQKDVEVFVPTTLITSPLNSDFEIYGEYDNAYSAAPPDILEKLSVMGWNNASYLLLKFTLVNRETNPINAKVGLDIIPYLDGEYGFDTVSYDAQNNIIRSHRGATNLGYRILSHQMTSMIAFEWFSGYEDADSSYWNWLNHGTIDAQYISNTIDGPVIIPSIASQQLAPGDSIVFYCGISVGADEAEMIANMQLVQQKYNQITSVQVESNTIPDKYSLEQNFPNPFNPETSIQFSVPQKEFVSLKIYNSLGQEVAAPVNQELDGGIYNVKFDGSGLSSGFYLYTIKAGNFVQTKKMILMK